MPSHLPDDRSSQSSVKDNVIYLNATQTQVEKSAESNSATPFNPLTDAFHQDGSVTVKSGGLPATAWQASAAELAKLLIGKQLGCYVIREALGTGAMAAVFKAYDPLLDRYIALKILPPVLAAQADQIQRFEREAKLAAQMDHEHVARVHYFGQDQGLHFIAYEYVEGTNLRVLMEQHGGKLPVPEGIRYLHQAALGLAHAAARGVIHRDIKPNNLVINKHGVLKLVDLGLARNSLDVSGEALTQAGATLGTFDYLSPEQAIDPRLADVRSDIYSLGCTFYHALTGMPPVPEGTAARKLQSHHQEKPVDPSRLNPAIPQELVHILARMLAKKPKDRYQTADELVADTSRLLSSYGDSSPARVSRLVKEPPPIPWHWQMAAILLLLLGILGYEVFSQRKPASSPAAIIAEYTESRNLNQQDIAGSTAKSDQVPVAPVTLEIETTEDLVQALRRNSGGTLLLKRELYELRASNLPVIKQGEWTIKPLHDKPTTLRLPEITNSNFIEVKAGSLRLENLVLDIAGLSSTGIQCYSGTHLQIENCEFQRSMANSLALTVIAPAPFIRVNSQLDENLPANLDIKGCIWHPSSGIGLLFDAPGFIQLEDCWIAPQHQTIVLPGMSNANTKRVVQLRKTAIALPTDSVIKIAGKSPVLLDIEKSIFSRLTGTALEEPAWLVMEYASAVDLQSVDTVYHRISNYAALQRSINARDVIARDWRQLRNAVGRCREEGTVLLTRSPWQESRPWQRFQDTRKLGMLSPRVDFQQYGPSELLGDRFSDTGLAQDPRSGNTGNRVLLVDGIGEDTNSFTTLSSAIGSIVDDEQTTIQIALQGTVTLKPTELGNSKIILQAAEGYRPEITFHRDTVAGPDGEAHLFRLHDGELILENLKFRLDTLRAPAKSLSLLTITGVGRCKFKECVVTLRGSTDLICNTITIHDPTGMSAFPSNIQALGVARIECTDSIIRGTGQLLHVQAGRPFSLNMQQTGIALDGTVCLLEGSRSNSNMPSDSGQIMMDRCTAYHTRGLVQIRTSLTMPELMPFRCSVTNSVLALGDNQPLIQVELQNAEADLKRKFSWQGRRNMYLGATGSIMRYQHFDRDAFQSEYDQLLWSEYWGKDDEQAQFQKSLPLSGILKQVSLHEWETVDFAVKLEGIFSLGLRDMGLPYDTMPRLPQP